MNILLATPWEIESPGGVSVVVHNLGSYLRRQGDHVIYLSASPHGTAMTTSVQGVRSYSVRMRSLQESSKSLRAMAAFILFAPFTLFRIAALIRRERIEAVNFHYFTDLAWYFVILKPWLRFKLIVSLHGSDVLGPVRTANMRLLHAWRKRINKLVFCSAGFRDEVLEGTSPDLAERSVIILNGIDLEKLDATLAKVSDQDRNNLILCLAHLREHKGQDVLLRAFAQFHERRRDFSLHFVGDGPLRPKLQRLRAELQLESAVHIHGEVERTRALELLARSAIFCLPSRREPFGLVLLEAMALRVPVVATNVGGIPEIIRDGVDGLLVSPDEVNQLEHALDEATSRPELRSTLVRNAEIRVRTQFTSERFAADYRRLFTSLLSGAAS